MKIKNLKNIIIQTLTWLSLFVIVIITLGFSEKQRLSEKCNKIIIQILDSNKNHFINSKDILEILNNKNFKLLNNLITNINLNEIETELNSLPWIKKTEAYTTIDGKLFIDLIQKTPMLRVINYNNESYYIDEEGTVFSLSDNYSARVLIVSGDINEPYALYAGKKAYLVEKQNNDEIKRNSLLDEIYYIANNIYNDTLLKPLIEQIYVKNNEFELIPKFGDLIIEIGDTNNLKTKLLKLKLFYQQIMPKLNGDEYCKISLKYKNQVVCTKTNLNYESK
jgi:cell division protein FtsQ